MPRDKGFAYQADYSYYGIQPVGPKIGFSFHHEVLKMSNFDEFTARLESTDYVAIDTETTGLEFADVDLVTVQFSMRVDMEIYSYMAFFHSGYVQACFPNKLDRLPSRYQILLLVKKALTRKFCIFHNRVYDEHVLLYAPTHVKLYDSMTMEEDLSQTDALVENPLSEIDFYKSYDNLALWFQMDSNCLRGLSIKDLAPTYLGINMEHFDEKVGEDILTSSPKTLLDYGCLDTYVTLSLFLLAFPRFAKKAPLLAKLLPAFTTANFSFAQQEQYVNLVRAQELYDEVTERIEKVKEQFYTTYGQINLGSSLQKSRLLISLGYSTGEYSKPRPDGEQVLSLKAKLMDKLVKQGCPPAELMVKYNKLIKLQSSYAKVLLNFCMPDETGHKNKVRFYFQESRAPTLRLACGKYSIQKRAYPYFIPMNVQALPKPHSIIRGIDYDPKTYEFKFYEDAGTVQNPKGQYCVETGDDNLNFRSCFTAPDGYIFIKSDYSAEELFCMANVAPEPVWLDAIHNNVDLHNATAKAAFHLAPNEHVDKNLRKKAKICNFALGYSLPGSYWPLIDATGSEQAAMELEANYRAGLPSLYQWKNRCYAQARMQGYIVNSLGHERSVRRYLEARSKKMYEYAEKTAVSHMIQGMCGVIMRIDMVKLWKRIVGPDRIYNKDYDFSVLSNNRTTMPDVWLFWTVHDEMICCCKKELAVKVAHMISDIMVSTTPPSFQTPLKAEPEVGVDIGHLVAMHFETIDGVEYLIPDEEDRPSEVVEEQHDAVLEQITEDEEDTEVMAGFEF